MDERDSFLEALKSANGDLILAFDVTGIGAELHHRWLEEDELYRNAVDNITLVLAESQLAAKVRNGDLDAIKFILETKGKKLGYTKTMDVTMASAEQKEAALSEKDRMILNLTLPRPEGKPH